MTAAAPLEMTAHLAYRAALMRAIAGADGERGALLRAALDRRDHRAALRLLMAEHGTAVHGYCVRVLGDPALGADVQQQVFEQAYRDLATLKSAEHARSWIFGIAHHRCLDAIKARRRAEKRFSHDEEEIDLVAAEPRDLGASLDAPVLARALDECIRALSHESRMAVLLRFQEGMTYEDMGRMCREKPATLQARVSRALPGLRRCLEEKGVEP